MTNGSLNGRRRVVITGLGAVTPLGNDVETTWESLSPGSSGAGPITQFDSTDYAVHFACEVKDFDPTEYIDRKQARRMDRFAHLIVAAARQAEADSGPRDRAKESDRVGAAIATGIGGLKAFQDCHSRAARARPRPRQPVLDPGDHPEHGRGLGLDAARDAGPAQLAVHGLRRVEHGDRRRRSTRSGSAART